MEWFKRYTRNLLRKIVEKEVGTLAFVGYDCPEAREYMIDKDHTVCVGADIINVAAILEDRKTGYEL